MTQFFPLLYAISSFGFIIGCIPQIIHILKTKTVEGISLQTYDMWFAMQVISMPYIYQSADPLWIGANIVWLVYYAAMVVMIQHYRYPHYIRMLVSKFVHVLRILPVPARVKN